MTGGRQADRVAVRVKTAAHPSAADNCRPSPQSKPDPRTDHHHPLDRPCRSRRNIGSPVVKTLSSQPGHPRPGAGPIPHCGSLRAAG
jgi:hypothetical protein